MVEPHNSNFRVITTNFLGVWIFRKFTVFSACPTNTYDYNCTGTCDCLAANTKNPTQTCYRTTGVCDCLPTWSGTRCETDVDECTLGTDDCATKPNTACNNVDGGFECNCVAGYQKTAQGNCEGNCYLSRVMTKPTKWVCIHQRLRSAWASPSLIRVFAVHLKEAWDLSYPLSAQWRLWSDWADAQADLSLRWAHSHIVGFVMRQLILDIKMPCPFAGSNLSGGTLAVIFGRNCINYKAYPEAKSLFLCLGTYLEFSKHLMCCNHEGVWGLLDLRSL